MTEDGPDFVSALKKARMPFPEGKEKRQVKVQWLSILAHSAHTQNHSRLPQIHIAFSPQFALQRLSFINLPVTLPFFFFFVRLTQHK